MSPARDQVSRDELRAFGAARRQKHSPGFITGGVSVHLRKHKLWFGLREEYLSLWLLPPPADL